MTESENEDAEDSVDMDKVIKLSDLKLGLGTNKDPFSGTKRTSSPHTSLDTMMNKL